MMVNRQIGAVSTNKLVLVVTTYPTCLAAFSSVWARSAAATVLERFPRPFLTPVRRDPSNGCNVTVFETMVWCIATGPFPHSILFPLCVDISLAVLQHPRTILNLSSFPHCNCDDHVATKPEPFLCSQASLPVLCPHSSVLYHGLMTHSQLQSPMTLRTRPKITALMPAPKILRRCWLVRILHCLMITARIIVNPLTSKLNPFNASLFKRW
ncbi:hypothetical protein F5887DRAFT_564850 [Amanita rubescens]|nr:hypothetical protein F5887DRAFT_564850 [Amanita rubescens]